MLNRCWRPAASLQVVFYQGLIHDVRVLDTQGNRRRAYRTRVCASRGGMRTKSSHTSLGPLTACFRLCCSMTIDAFDAETSVHNVYVWHGDVCTFQRQ